MEFPKKMEPPALPFIRNNVLGIEREKIRNLALLSPTILPEDLWRIPDRILRSSTIGFQVICTFTSFSVPIVLATLLVPLLHQ